MNDLVRTSPLISVIVPVYNAERFIGACIESLLAMEYPHDRVEIIVVDNNSTDQTRKIIDSYRVVAHREGKQGHSAARQAGIEISRGDIIASTDADCRAATLLVFRMLLAIRIGGFLTFKIYKIFHGIGYDLAILQDRMAQR